LVGIFPLVTEREKRAGLPARIIRPLSHFHQVHGTPMIVGEPRAAVMEALFQHVGRAVRWDLWFMVLMADDAQRPVFDRRLAELGYHVLVQPGDRSPYRTLDTSWDECMRRLQPRFRTTLRSREKRLREKGKVELIFFDGASDWPQGMQAIREIEEDSWK